MKITFLKKLILIYLVLITSSFIFLCFIKFPTINKTVYTTNTIIKQNTVIVPKLIDLTNGITNQITLTNILNVYMDMSHYDTDSFVGIQSNDVFNVSLYKREAQFKLIPWINEKQFYLGAGVEFLYYNFNTFDFSPEIVGGYSILNWLGVDLHISKFASGIDVLIKF